MQALSGSTVPVVVDKSDEERVEGVQVSDQYGELVHDKKLCLRHLTPALCLAVLFIHQHNRCFLHRSHRKNAIVTVVCSFTELCV